MTEEHGKFERLVVGHVLGDLPETDASRFRAHLLGCRECRARVAELRGIAADLADAERDELARARVRTEAPRRVDQPDASLPTTGPRITVRHVTVAAVVVVLLSTAMAFWNLYLRQANADYLDVVEARDATLEGLASGLPLELELASGVSGLAVADGEQVALTLTGIDPLAEGEQIVAWILGVEDAEGGIDATRLAIAGRLDAGDPLATTIEDGGGKELVITRETAPGDRPGDDVLLRASLLGS
jgi:hypothetical protein